MMNTLTVKGVTIEYETGLVATVEDDQVVVRYHIAPGPGYCIPQVDSATVRDFPLPPNVPMYPDFPHST